MVDDMQQTLEHSSLENGGQLTPAQQARFVTLVKSYSAMMTAPGKLSRVARLILCALLGSAVGNAIAAFYWGDWWLGITLLVVAATCLVLERWGRPRARVKLYRMSKARPSYGYGEPDGCCVPAEVSAAATHQGHQACVSRPCADCMRLAKAFRAFADTESAQAALDREGT